MAHLKLSVITSILILCVPGAPLAFAQSNLSTDAEAPAHRFEKKRYKIEGTASLVNGDNGLEIQFSDDFKTKGGPDLKVYLSKKPISILDSDSVDESSHKIGVLKAKSGAQSYRVPDGIILSDYQSVIIHCEAFSVLWGGFDLR